MFTREELDDYLIAIGELMEVDGSVATDQEWEIAQFFVASGQENENEPERIAYEIAYRRSLKKS